MPSDKMLKEKTGAIGWMTFNNPERHNAVSLDMWEAAASILADFAADGDVRVIVVTGAGGKAFVSGADISKFESERASADAIAHYDSVSGTAFTGLEESRKPTIAMIDGYCIGGGLAVAISCDIRICSAKSRFGIPAARLGLGYAFDGLRRLVGLVGPAFAKEIMFTASRFDSDRALATGLVNRVVVEGDLKKTVTELAETIAGNAPLTVAAAKRIIGEIQKDADERDLELCRSLVEACFDSEDYVEGRTAFMEKRKPNFVGR